MKSGNKHRAVTPNSPFGLRLSLLAAVLLLALSGCTAVPQPAPHSTVAAASAAPVTALEARYGIQFTRLAVTGAGSWIDLRYRVVDMEKAMQWMADPALRPTLMVEHSGTALNPPPMGHHAQMLEVGRHYYSFYGNTGGAVRPGDRVTLVVGDLRVGPITAQ